MIQNADPRPNLLTTTLKGSAGVNQSKRNRGGGEHFNRGTMNERQSDIDMMCEKPNTVQN